MKFTPKPWFWGAWLVGIALTFAGLEAWGWTTGVTFSSFMWTVSLAWPPWIFLWGLLIGGLAVHFWWHWGA